MYTYLEESFITRGFSNWKDAKVAFVKHENSNYHKEAVHSTITVPKCYKDCAEMLSTQHAKEKGDNRHMLYKLLSNIRFLARQGLALRGNGQEEDSNFVHLMKLRGMDNPRVFDWIQKRSHNL